MGKKTINQALKDLFLGLGGNPSALSDNTSVSDYIEDLEGAIEGKASDIAGDMIDDTTASESTVYSSSKVESLIPTDELPSVSSEDINQVLTVVSDGESGAKWDKAAPIGLPAIESTDNYKALRVNSNHTAYEKVNLGIYGGFVKDASAWFDSQTPTTTPHNFTLSQDVVDLMSGSSGGFGLVHFCMEMIQDHYLYFKVSMKGAASSSANNNPQAICIYPSDDGTKILCAVIRITNKSTRAATLTITDLTPATT